MLINLCYSTSVGADIHDYVEVIIPSNTPGEAPVINCVWRSAFKGRDYLLFGLLANVRGDGPVYPLRGVPSEMSTVADAELREDGDIHSRGWLNYVELCVVSVEYTRVSGDPKSGLEPVLEVMRQLIQAGLECRYVFGFDN